MYKIIVFTLFVLYMLFPGITNSQCYTVLSVKGEIILEKTGQPIKEMDEICSTDKLKFSSNESKAAVLSSEQGRYIIRPTGKVKTDALFAFVSSVLVQGKERLSTKGIESIESEFGDKYFVVGTNKVIVDLGEFPMNEKSFFSIKYIYEEKEFNIKLKFKKDTLFFDKGIYFNDEIISNQDKINSVSLYYQVNSNSNKITSFNLIFADEEKLKTE